MTIKSSKYELIENKVFYVSKNTLHSIQLSSSIKKINNEEIEMNRNALYLPRLKAVEEINQKFNLDVTIEINQNYREGVKE